MENLVRKDRILKYIFMIPIAVLFCMVAALFIHGFFSYTDADYVDRFAGVFEKIFLMAGMVAFFAFLFYTLGVILSRLSDKTIRRIEVLVCMAGVLLQFFFLFYIKSYYKWDTGYVISAAASLVEQGVLSPESYHYVSVYPNQNTFVCITAVLIKIANFFHITVEDRPLFFNVVNTILMDIAIGCVIPIFLKVIKRKLSDWEIARWLIILLLNPFWYLGTSFYYTLTLSLPFTMGFLYCFLCILEGKGKWSIAVLAGCLLGIGYDIRPTAIIFITAAVITFLYRLLLKKEIMWKKCCTQMGILLITALLTGGILAYGEVKFIGIDTTDSAYPTVHWLMMSATSPGCHNVEDEGFTDSFATHEEKVEAVTKRLKEKLQNMGVTGYCRLAATKVNRTFGDGSNGYTHFLTDGYGTGAVFDWLFGSHKDLCILYHQGYYLFLMAGILCGVWKILKNTKKRVDDFGLYCLALTLFGAFLFYVLWESSPQYSIPFMGLMSALAFSGYSEPQILQDSAGKRMVEIAMAVFLIAIPLYGLLRYPLYVRTEQHFSKTAVNQLMETAKMIVDEETPLYQPIDLNIPCNQLALQWRNYLENNNSVYQVDVLENEKPLRTEYIYAAETAYRGIGIYLFDTIIPDDEKEYAIQIQKIDGDKDKSLCFVTYDMYGYNPYPEGKIQALASKGRNAALLFQLSLEYDGYYISTYKYIALFAMAELLLAGEFFIVLNSGKEGFFKKRKKHPVQCL